MPPTPKPRASHLLDNDDNRNDRSTPSTPPLSQSRARRLRQKATPESSKSITVIDHDDEEKETSAINNAFIAKIRENDTLARFKRETPSPSPSSHTDGTSRYLIFVKSFQLSLENPLARANASARQRRREQRVLSATATSVVEEEHPQSPITASVVAYDRSMSNDSQVDAVEQERKAKRDINDFLHQLDATLRLPTATASSTAREMPLMFDRTMIATTKLEERRDALRENCLQEMSSKELQQVLDLLDRVSETEIKQKMINILGPEVYEKYCAQIYTLKYYESSLYTRQ